MAKYPDYKPKYKSLSKKDKADAKYISKTTPAQRQFNRVAGDVVSTIVGPLGALKVLPKATRVVKELATKFTQAKKTLPEAAQVTKPQGFNPSAIKQSLKKQPGDNPAFGVRKRIVENSLPPGSTVKKTFTKKFNKAFDDIANEPSNYHSGAGKLVRKATNPILKEAIKTSRNPSTARQTLSSMEKAARNASNARVNQKLDAAKRLQDAAFNKAMEKAYRPKFEKPTQEMIDKAGPVTIIKPQSSNLGKPLKSSRVPDPGSWDDVPWQGRDILKIKKPRKK